MIFILLYKKYIINNFISMNNNFTIDGIDGIDMNNDCNCSDKIINLILQLKKNQCETQDCCNEKYDLFKNINYYNSVNKKKEVIEIYTNNNDQNGSYDFIYMDKNYDIKLKKLDYYCKNVNECFVCVFDKFN
jgi:hypothetical protein